VRPTITADSAAHYDALKRGELILQRCEACHCARMPAMPVCTRCGSDRAAWIGASGQGRVHSWVRYHRPYLPEFESMVPYAVLAVQLDEGPVMFGRLVTPVAAPRIGQSVKGVVERWSDGFCGLAFELTQETA
jgi:hypothetical protein